MSLGVKVPGWAHFKTGDKKVELLTKFVRKVTEEVLGDKMQDMDLDTRLKSEHLENTLTTVLSAIKEKEEMMKVRHESEILQLEDHFSTCAKYGFRFDPKLTPEQIRENRLREEAVEKAKTLNPYHV